MNTTDFDLCSECMNRTDAVVNSINYTLDNEMDYPEYYSYRYRIIGTFFQGVVFIVGVLGNAMVVIVVKRTQSMHSPTNCYLVSLAVADCVVLISSVPNEILSYYLIGNRWIWGEVGCTLFTFCQNLGINASSLSLVAFTLERYIAICHPMRAHAVCTVNRAKRIILAVWLFALIYCSPWLGLTETRPLRYRGISPETLYCDFKLPREKYLAYFFADLVVFYLVPLLLSCILYALIARVLFARRVAGTRGGGLTGGRLKGSASAATGGKSSNGTVHVVVDTASANSARAQVVKMLAVVVAVFATLWLPYRGLLVYNSFAEMFSKERFMDLWFLMFAKTCVFINSAINPILYNALSFKFRRAFQRTLTCRRRGECSGMAMRRDARGNLGLSTYTCSAVPPPSTMAGGALASGF